MSIEEKLKFMGYYITRVIEYKGKRIPIAKYGLEKAIFVETVNDEIIEKICKVATPLGVKVYTINNKYQLESVKCSYEPTRQILRRVRLFDELVEGTTIPRLKRRYGFQGGGYINLVKLLTCLRSWNLLIQSGQFVKIKRPLTLEEKIELLLITL